MTKRKSLVICLVVALALSLLMAITCMIPQSAALADGEDFAVKGASLRYTTTEKENGENDDGTGLRFVLNAKQTYIDAAEEIGLLLIPADMLEEGEELTVETEDAIKNPKGDSDWTVDGDYMSTYFYLWNIPETDCDREVVARGYAKVDGNYVYTTEQERSFESVAIAAMAGSANTQEDKDMCAALSKYVVTDPGNVAYFGTDNVVNVSATGDNGASNFGTVDFGGEKVHKIGWTSPAGLRIQAAPVIKDFSAYNYFYMDFYIAGEGNYTMNPGVIWANDISIPANQWTRLVFAKDANGVFKTADGKTLLREDFNSTYVGLVDISFGVDVATSIDVYFREMRLTNAVPSLGIKLGDVVEGDTVTIADTYEVVNAENATVNVKVSVDGAAATAITEATYTFAKKGTYTFIYDFIVDGKTVTYSKTVKATVKTYTIADFTDANAVTTYDLVGNFEANIVYDVNSNATRMDSNPYAAYTGMLVNNPAISNVSSYKYVFIDVKVGWADANFIFNFVWNTPGITLTGCMGETEIWTRVVIENNGSGTFTLPKATCNASEGQPTNGNAFGQGVSSANIAGIGLHILSGGNNVYFGKFAACNELPELPEGYRTNLTPEEVEAKKVNAIVDFTAANTVDTYGLVGAFSGETSMSVTPEIANITYPVNAGLPMRINAVSMGGITINSPAITAISEYNYIYIDLMIAYGDAEFVLNYVWGAPKILVKGGNTWTRVVLVNDGNGNFTIPNATGSITDGYDGTAVAVSGTVNAYTMVVLAADNWAYFGMFAATDTLPELPQGFETNYTGEAA